MTCYRVGWVVGDKRIVDIFKKVKINVDSGTATLYKTAQWLPSATRPTLKKREEYRVKREVLVDAFQKIRLPDCTPKPQYIWGRRCRRV